MIRDLINREKIKRVLLYLLYIVVAQFFQDTIFASLPLFGVNMMFMPAVVVAIGAFEGGVWGAALGLVTGFLTDISYDNTVLFAALFPAIGFFAGVLTRWFVNASLFAYLVMCLAAFAVTAAFQILEPLYLGSSLMALLWTGLVPDGLVPANGRRTLLPVQGHRAKEGVKSSGPGRCQRSP